MRIKRLIVTALFFSIFLYAKVVKENNLSNNLPIKTKLEKKEDNKTVLFKKMKSRLIAKLKGRIPLPKDIKQRRFLRRFYRQNSYIPIWFTADGLKKKRVEELFQELEADITLNRDGKIYKEYQHVKNYISKKDRDNTNLELHLTELYMNFLNHIIYGSIKWKSFGIKLKQLRKRGIPANWVTYKPKYSVSDLLLEPNIKETIHEITPKRFGYKQLIKALEHLQKLKKRGGWEALPKFRKLGLGDKGLMVLKLRERLKKSGDLNGSCEKAPANLFEVEVEEESEEKFEDVKIKPDAIFDKCLESAVKRFQARHGLEADGVVGKGTRRALNVSIDEKISNLLLNIDRIKWLPRENEKRYIVVNIPEYILHYIEDEFEKETIPVVVGKKKHNTPIFRGEISYIVLNPYWKVPAGIVRREIIPRMVKNPRYLKKEGLEIHTTWYEKSPKVNPYTIYWKQYYYGYAKFPYRIMQPPGPKNALGKIKFKFPNRFNVYLHDTPAKRLFKKSKRAFSHGCIRVSKPVELFETIASFNNIDINRSRKILEGKNKVQINIKKTVPVYLIYITAGYDERKKIVEFRDDIYGYDKLQKRVK